MSPTDRRRFLGEAGAVALASLPAARAAVALPLGDELLRVLEAYPVGTAALSPAVYPVQAVPVARVNVTDRFWRPRMEANRRASLGHCLDRFEDGDVFGVSKLVEAAAYMLTERSDPALQRVIERRIEAMIASVESRLEEPARSVQVSGHFLEAAHAYYEATGERRMLDVAMRAADQMDSAYGPGKATHISGHQGLKIGLVALYRATGDERYWRLAKFFADERGRDDYERSGEYAIDRTYAQDHLPVIEQTEAVGHCVRATYLYIAMTDIAALSGSEAYRSAIDAIWQDAVYNKTYLTGGVGSVRFHEQYGEPYELPNLSAWNETCAAHGNAVWNHRLFLLTGNGQYIDLMERILYNATLVGVSLAGDRFFYQNPLMSFGDYERFEWINVPCCPPNVIRMLAQVGEYIYATDGTDLYVNLFVDSNAEVGIGETPVNVRQETRYPWDGRVKVHVDPKAEVAFALHVRVPGWARGVVMPGGLYEFVDAAGTASGERPTLSVDGRAVPLELENGYARIERPWRAGDVVELNLPMPVRQVAARTEARDNRHRVALQRGPLVYCAEWPDNGGRALNVVVAEDDVFASEFRPDLLEGIQVVRGQTAAIDRWDQDEVHTVPHELIAIPYFAWANRGMGEMAVWMARTPEVAWLPPVLPPGIASVSTSGGVAKSWTGYNDQNDDLGAVHDGRQPLNSADQSHRFFRMRPPVGEPAWLQYNFEHPTELSSARVYWSDDKRFCKLPDSWRILVLDSGEWKPVAAHDPYDVVKNAFNTVSFEPVVTTAVRLEVEPQTVPYEAGEIGPPAAMFISEHVDWREFGLIEWHVE